MSFHFWILLLLLTRVLVQGKNLPWSISGVYLPMETHSKALSMLSHELGDRKHYSTLYLGGPWADQPHPWHKWWVCSPIAAFSLLSTASSTCMLLPGLPPLRHAACPLQHSYAQVCGKLTEWDQTSFQVSSCSSFSWRKITSIPAKTKTPINSDYYFTLQLVFVSQSVSTNSSDALPPWKASIIILIPNNRLDASVHVATLFFKAVIKQSNYCSNQTLDTFHNQQ